MDPNRLLTSKESKIIMPTTRLLSFLVSSIVYVNSTEQNEWSQINFFFFFEKQTYTSESE